MEIKINKSYSGCEIIVTDTNVKLEHDVFETFYGVKEDGTKDWSNRIGYDITDEGLQIFSSVLEDLFYYRERDFDSSDMLKQAFDKLPVEKQTELLTKWQSEYL